MKLRIIATLAFLALGAVAQDVQYNFDPAADFTKYKTYSWQKHPKSLDVNELTLNMLGQAFEAEFTKKGMTKAASGTGDLVLVWQIAVSQEKEMTTFDTGYGMGPGWRGGWYGGYGGSGMSTSTTSTINIGTVVIDMYDASTKKLAWRGMGSKAIDAKAKPDKQAKNAKKLAEKLLKNYPPKKKS